MVATLTQRRTELLHSRTCTCSMMTNAGDPTRTTMIRNAFVRDMTKRFRNIEKDIRTSIVTNDCFGLKEDTPLPRAVALNRFTTNKPLPSKVFKFNTDPQKVDGFMTWLSDLVDRDILQITTGAPRRAVGNVPWANVYIDSAYKRGMKRADEELIKAGVTPSELPAGKNIFSIDARFNQPFHASKVAAIYTRTYRELKGISDEMEQIISQRLAQGLAEGKGPMTIARQINDAIEKRGESLSIGQGRRMRSITRARILARTEVIRAHHVATIETYREAGIEGVTVKAEWSTAGDDRVCPDCAFMEGRIFTLDEISSLIPLHPQCRCVALPFLPKVETEPNLSADDQEQFVGDNYLDSKGRFRRRGFYEDKTGKVLPGVPKPGARKTKPGTAKTTTTPKTAADYEREIAAKQAQIAKIEKETKAIKKRLAAEDSAADKTRLPTKAPAPKAKAPAAKVFSQTESKQLSQKTYDVLDEDTQAALRQYKEDSTPFNEFLRGQPIDVEYMKRVVDDVVEELDRTFKNTAPFKQDVKVWRGSSSRFKKLKVGDTFKDDAYVSTTTEKTLMEEHIKESGVQFEITVPAGKKGVFLDAKELVDEIGFDEWELLLDRGSRFIVTRIDETNPFPILHVTLL